jgi:hypothetical protein
MKNAILFLIFNRPETTFRVFEAIRSARPERLYIAADGARINRPDDLLLCSEARRVATMVDWPCRVVKLFRDENVGCKLAVSTAIDWFFDSEDQGIILEDDCLPAPSFFNFCDVLLEKYKNDSRIWQISGSTFFPEAITPSKCDYFFSRYGPIWGWATWRRAWVHYEVGLKSWAEMSNQNVMNNVYSNKAERDAKLKLGNMLFNSKIDTWDYQWGYSKNFNSGLTIIPKYNQILNIGFGEGATHTVNLDPNAPNQIFDLSLPIIDPKYVYEDRLYDEYFAERVYRHKPRIFSIIKNKILS